jgi:hypothetical protein
MQFNQFRRVNMKFLNPYHRKLLAAGICLLPLTGFAAEDSGDLSYGYIQADYINLDIDQPGEDDVFEGDFDNGGGLGLSVSIPLNEVFYLFGDYSETDSDFAFADNTGTFIPGNVDLQRVTLGGGFIMPMNERSDLVFSGGYSDIDFDHFGFGASPGDNSLDDLDDDPSDGYVADVKWRSQWTQAIEGTLGARYTDIEAADGLSFIGSVLFELSPNWGLNLSVDAGDELITYGAGVRMTF